MSDRSGFGLFLLGMLCLALLAALFPMSFHTSTFRPEWVCLIVTYALLYRPEYMGIGRAWVVGLVQDILEGAVWGAHAIALAFLAYICILSYRRLRSYPLYQQCAWVFILVGVHQIFVNWIQGLAGYDAPSRIILVSSITSALVWPMVVLLLRRIEWRYRL